jgi:hypothetical protein
MTNMTTNGSFTRHLVSNIPAILTSGSTENLAIQQIGIFDGETYKAVTNPVYSRNKSIIIAQGMGGPQVDVTRVKMSGLPGTRSEKTDIIRGSLIRNFKSFRGKKGQNETLAIGYDGADPTKTLTGRKGENKYLWIKLTGEPITKLASPRGLILRYSVFTGVDQCCGPECTDCTPADINAMADSFVDQINSDPRHSGMLRATKKTYCSTGGTPPTTEAWDTWQLTVNDMGEETALGRVAAQYAGYEVSRYQRDNAQALSTYRMYRKSGDAPAAFTTSTTTLVPDCPTCPAGYTQVSAAHLFEVAQTSAAAAPSGADIVGTPQLLGESEGRKTYLVGYTMAKTVDQGYAALDVDGVDAIYIRDSQVICTLTTPTTVAWADVGDGKKTQRYFRLTLQDTECGTDRLAELSKAYAGIGTVTKVANAADPNTCTHTYQLPVMSNVIETACYTQDPLWLAPPGYKGSLWQEVIPQSDAQGCSYGIILEGAFVSRITGECTYGYYAYESDGVHIQASNYDMDYNVLPQADDFWWDITPLQRFTPAQNIGAQIRPFEESSKEMSLRVWSMSPAVREAEGFKLFTDPYQFYDQYALWYTKRIGVGGFSTVYEDKHLVNVYFPAGQGSAFANAINGYITSVPGLLADASAL